MTAFPDSVVSSSGLTGNSAVTLGAASHSQIHLAVANEIIAIETELGVNPAGSNDSVADRLIAIENSLATGSTSSQVSNLTVDTLCIGSMTITQGVISSVTITSLQVTNAINILTVNTLYIATLGTIGNVQINAGNITATTLQIANITNTVAFCSPLASVTTIVVANLTNSVAMCSPYGTFTTASISNLTVGQVSQVTTASSVNLNADVLDGKHASELAISSHTHAGTMMVQIVAASSTVNAGDGQCYFFIPNALNGTNITDADACVNTTSTSTVNTSIQLYNVTDSVDILGTNIYIDANEKTSYTAATASSISNSAISTGDEIRVDTDAVGSGTKGLWVHLKFQ